MNPYGIRETPQTVLLEIAEKHKRLRKRRGYTQAELAERSGVSLGSLKRFERSGQISMENLLKLAHVLNRLSDFRVIFTIDTELEEVERLFSNKMRK